MSYLHPKCLSFCPTPFCTLLCKEKQMHQKTIPDQKFRDENRGGTKTHVASHYSFCVSHVETNTFFAWKFARLWAVMFIESKLLPNFTFPHRGPYWAFVSPLWCILVTDYYKFRSKTSVISIIIIMKKVKKRSLVKKVLKYELSAIILQPLTNVKNISA